MGPHLQEPAELRAHVALLPPRAVEELGDPLVQVAMGGCRGIRLDPVEEREGREPLRDDRVGIADGRGRGLLVRGRSAAALQPREDSSEWLFARLDKLFAAAADAFGLPVGPLVEPVQILRYEAGGHFATWHSDAGLDAHDRRRISTSVELSERSDYEGGELEIVPDLVGRPRTLPRGSAQLFPSRALHRVTPVVRGRRWALVAWTGLPEG